MRSINKIQEYVEKNKLENMTWQDDHLLLRDGSWAVRGKAHPKKVYSVALKGADLKDADKSSLIYSEVNIETRTNEELPALQLVWGSVDLAEGASAPMLTHVRDTVTMGLRAYAPNLVYVGGRAIIAEGADIEELQIVKGDVYLCTRASAPSLFFVGGSVTLCAGSTAQLLRTVLGSVNMSYQARADSLMYVGKRLSAMEGSKFPDLRHVGYDDDYVEGYAAPNLIYVGDKKHDVSQYDHYSVRRLNGRMCIA